MDKFKGTWLMIKTGHDYCQPEFIEFGNDQVYHFELLEKTKNGLLEKKQKRSEKLSDTKYEFINDNRIRFHRMGKTHTVISETESITEDTIFKTDYEKIGPTETNLIKQQIQQLELTAEWNGEKIPIAFNKDLDSPTIRQINKRLRREGQKLVLETLQGTYFASIYDDGERRTLIGIREIDGEKAVLFGFPEKPYEVTAK